MFKEPLYIYILYVVISVCTEYTTLNFHLIHFIYIRKSHFVQHFHKVKMLYVYVYKILRKFILRKYIMHTTASEWSIYI